MLIVKTGSAFAEARRRFGDFERWFAAGIGTERFHYETVAVADDDRLPPDSALDEYAGVVVTGSPAMVSHRNDWSEATAAWLAAVMDADRLPVLGVCYGHQLMAHALGGEVGPNPNGRRMGTRQLTVEAADDELLATLAPGADVHVTHLESVIQPPSAARVLGSTEGDPFHALHFGGRNWSVQFHPEFDAPIMRCYVRGRSDLLDREGFDSGAILESVRETAAGSTLLKRFAEICEASRGDNHGESC
jgi:GMP synthase (glutamine-hydrolysing)